MYSRRNGKDSGMPESRHPGIAYRMGDGSNRGVISRDRLPGSYSLSQGGAVHAEEAFWHDHDSGQRNLGLAFGAKAESWLIKLV